MKKGQKVKFEMHDSLREEVIIATGVLVLNIWGKLWTILPDEHIRLSGKKVQVHEDFIKLIE